MIIKSNIFYLLLSILSVHVWAQSSPPPIISGPFGSKAIQLSIDSKGITRKEGGYICSVKAAVNGAPYSEWGETEKDARTIVLKKCSGKSGLLLCKSDNVTCKEDK